MLYTNPVTAKVADLENFRQRETVVLPLSSSKIYGIIAFNDDSVTLKNGSKVPVSTRKRAEIKKVFRDYISKHAKIM